MDKLKMHSPNLTQASLARLRELFPGCVSEAKDADGQVKLAVDFDLLRQEVSESVVEGPQERYHLNWPGKRTALLAANAPIAKTLRPVRGESLEFDKTKNIFIEGDNLDVLKLLQESYLGKIKFIYIDPPYNTGGDLIYEDDFAENLEDYLRRSNQKDEHGGHLVVNTESNGRFHSDWLCMIYPRLKLARNLLSEDGVICVSIDDGESANLKHLLNEVFGEENFIDTIAIEMSTTSGPKTVNAQQGTIVKNVEFVHVYRKSIEFDRLPHLPLLDGIDSYDTHYSVWMNEDGTLGNLVEKMLADEAINAEINRFGLIEKGKFSIKNMDKLLSVSEVVRSFIEGNLDKIARIDRPPVLVSDKSTQVDHWEPFEADHRTYYITTLSNGNLQALMPLSLNYRMSDDYKPRFGRTVIRGDLWKGFHQDMGNVAKEGDIAFANGKKPIRLLKQLMKWANNTRDGVILDFFAGSGTTAHAVLQANAEDGGNRRFIVVQLDETPEPKSDVAKAGYKTISELTRERIRRASRSIKENPMFEGQDIDLGFRAFTIDTSNMAPVYYAPDGVDHGQLPRLVGNVGPDGTAGSLAFQVIFHSCADLAMAFVHEVLIGTGVSLLRPDALAACFDAEGGIDESLIKELAKRKPLRAVFRDAGFKDDAARINAEQIFKLLSPTTDIKCI